MSQPITDLTAKPIRSQYVYARKLGTNDTVMVTVDEAQRRGYLVFDYESRTYRPLDTVSATALRQVPAADLMKS